MIAGSIDKALVKAIQQAASEAAEKGVSVTVELHEQGFFSNERVDITVTAKPQPGRA